MHPFISAMHTVLREARLKNNACSYSTTTPHSSFTQSLRVPCLKRVDFKEKLVDAAEIKALLGSGGDGLASLTGGINTAVIRHLRQHSSNISDPAPVAHFYCSRDPAEPECSDPREIFRSLAKQLSLAGDGRFIRHQTVEKYQKRQEEARHAGETSASLAVEECTELICELGRTAPVTLVIDGLDECRLQQRAVLMDSFDEVHHNCRDVVKIFVSSRHKEDITGRYGNEAVFNVTSKANEADLEQFVKTHAEKFVKRWSAMHDETAETLQQLEKEITDTLIAGSQGM